MRHSILDVKVRRLWSDELNYDGRGLMIRHWKKCYSVDICPQWKVSAKLQIEVGVSIDRVQCNWIWPQPPRFLRGMEY